MAMGPKTMNKPSVVKVQMAELLLAAIKFCKIEDQLQKQLMSKKNGDFALSARLEVEMKSYSSAP